MNAKEKFLNNIKEYDFLEKSELIRAIPLNDEDNLSSWINVFLNSEETKELFDLERCYISPYKDQCIDNITYVFALFYNNHIYSLKEDVYKLYFYILNTFNNKTDLYKNELLTYNTIKLLLSYLELMNKKESFDFLKEYVGKNNYSLDFTYYFNRELRIEKLNKTALFKYLSLYFKCVKNINNSEDLYNDIFFLNFSEKLINNYPLEVFKCSYKYLKKLKIEDSYFMYKELNEDIGNKEHLSYKRVEDIFLKWIFKSFKNINDNNGLINLYDEIIKNNEEIDYSISLYLINLKFNLLKKYLFNNNIYKKDIYYSEVYSIIMNNLNNIENDDKEELFVFIDSIAFNDENITKYAKLSIYKLLKSVINDSIDSKISTLENSGLNTLNLPNPEKLSREYRNYNFNGVNIRFSHSKPKNEFENVDLKEIKKELDFIKRDHFYYTFIKKYKDGVLDKAKEDLNYLSNCGFYFLKYFSYEYFKEENKSFEILYKLTTEINKIDYIDLKEKNDILENLAFYISRTDTLKDEKKIDDLYQIYFNILKTYDETYFKIYFLEIIEDSSLVNVNNIPDSIFELLLNIIDIKHNYINELFSFINTRFKNKVTSIVYKTMIIMYLCKTYYINKKWVVDNMNNIFSYEKIYGKIHYSYFSYNFIDDEDFYIELNKKKFLLKLLNSEELNMYRYNFTTRLYYKFIFDSYNQDILNTILEAKDGTKFLSSFIKSLSKSNINANNGLNLKQFLNTIDKEKIKVPTKLINNLIKLSVVCSFCDSEIENLVDILIKNRYELKYINSLDDYFDSDYVRIDKKENYLLSICNNMIDLTDRNIGYLIQIIEKVPITKKEEFIKAFNNNYQLNGKQKRALIHSLNDNNNSFKKECII